MSTLVRYAGATTDFNPIHFDETYAAQSRIGRRHRSRTLAMGLVSEAVTDWIKDSGRVRSLSCRFSGSYRLRDTLTVSGEVVAIHEGLRSSR